MPSSNFQLLDLCSGTSIGSRRARLRVAVKMALRSAGATPPHSPMTFVSCHGLPLISLTSPDFDAADRVHRMRWLYTWHVTIRRVQSCHVSLGSCVTSYAGPHGEAQLYERWRRALRVRQSGADLKPPQAAVVKSDGGERCGNVGT